MRLTRTSEWLDAVRSSAFRASQAMIDQLIAQNMWAASAQLSYLGGAAPRRRREDGFSRGHLRAPDAG
jgi:hypothetical protein